MAPILARSVFWRTPGGSPVSGLRPTATSFPYRCEETLQTFSSTACALILSSQTSPLGINYPLQSTFLLWSSYNRSVSRLRNVSSLWGGASSIKLWMLLTHIAGESLPHCFGDLPPYEAHHGERSSGKVSVDKTRWCRYIDFYNLYFVSYAVNEQGKIIYGAHLSILLSRVLKPQIWTPCSF